MLTYYFWRYSEEFENYIIAMLMTVLVLPLDILLSPVEIITFIIWKVRNR